MRHRAAKGIDVGDCWKTTRTFSAFDTRLFGEITRDYNPVHYDESFAKSRKYHGRICHGLLVASMVTEIGGQIGWLATSMDFRFRKAVYFGDRIECCFTITDIGIEQKLAKATVTYTNQHGETVLECYLTGFLPNDQQRSILMKMLAEGDPTNGR